MKVHNDKARKLLMALGYTNAEHYGEQMVINRLKGMEVMVRDTVRLGVKDATLKKLMTTIIRAVKSGDVIEIIKPEVLENKTMNSLTTFANKVAQNTKEHESERSKKEVLPECSEAKPVPDQGNPEVVLVPSPHKEETKTILTEPVGLGRAREILLNKAREEARAMAAADSEKIVELKPRRTSKDEWPDLIETEKTPPGPETIQRAIFNVLIDASEDDPVTKDEVVKSITPKFPIKTVKSLKWNVDGFPHWLPKCFPFSVHQKDKKYWLAPKRG